MRYLDYQERRKHGTSDFPFALYQVNPLSPRYIMPLHWHKETEFIRILSGEFSLNLNGTDYLLTEGQCMFISSGVLHGGIPKFCTYECLVFDLTAVIQDISIRQLEIHKFLDSSFRICPIYDSKNPEILLCFHTIFDAFIEKEAGYSMRMLGSLFTLLGEILHYHYYQEELSTSSNMKKIQQYKTILSMIEQHYSEPLSLQALANTVHMNSHYFCRFFKELTDQTPIEYLNSYRVEAACEQLYVSQKSILEIALDCGFNDVSYFIKVFKKYKNLTPSEYRRKMLSSK